jgi:hypothetical protein
MRASVFMRYATSRATLRSAVVVGTRLDLMGRVIVTSDDREWAHSNRSFVAVVWEIMKRVRTPQDLCGG